VNFQQAVQSGLENYAKFDGRSGLSAFWFWVLFEFVVVVVASIVGGIIGLGFLDLLASLALLVPSVAVGARRLHDTGKSGWYQLAGIIPLVGWIYLIYLFIQPSDAGPNAFGDAPMAPSA